MGTYHIITAQITSFGIQSNKNDVNGVRGPIWKIENWRSLTKLSLNFVMGFVPYFKRLWCCKNPSGAVRKGSSQNLNRNNPFSVWIFIESEFINQNRNISGFKIALNLSISNGILDMRESGFEILKVMSEKKWIRLIWIKLHLILLFWSTLPKKPANIYSWENMVLVVITTIKTDVKLCHHHLELLLFLPT